MGSIAGRGGQIPHASSQKKNPEYKQQKQHCNKFNKDLKKKRILGSRASVLLRKSQWAK